MSIIFDQKSGVISLHTRRSTYQMKADELGVLLHTHYGGKIGGDDMSSQICTIDRGLSGNPYEAGKTKKDYSLDVLPQEYSCFGTGDYRTTALRAQNADGSQAAQLRFVDCRIEKGKYALEGLPAVYAAEDEAESLFVRLQDRYSGLEVELQYGVLPELDIITRSAKIINRGTSAITLQKAASCNLDWQFGRWDWLTFHGRHAMERNLTRQPLRHGVQAIGCVRGMSSHHYNPFSILCESSATEAAGECYGISFLYSGEFLMEAELDQVDQARLICAIHPDDFAWVLEPGESFQTPEVVLAYSNEGLGHLSRIFHKTIREHICRGEWTRKRRPVLINNWEATYFDFTGDKLVSIAQEAADLGIELFVMDDGWFGKRDDDNSGLGDWYPNEKKLGCTLKELGERITATGMQFGVWFEPEAISEDSDLYRERPEWAVQVPGRLPCLSRNQLILDFSRQDVQDYIIERMSAILSDAPISYVKWDFNRSICDKFSGGLDARHQGEFAHRYILGLYRVLETLTQTFPHVLFEGCAGGGGRFDAGMLCYTPQIWCSDNTDAVNRLDIQYGTSFGYPVSAMGAHVSAVPNHQTGRVTPLSTRASVAMAGTFGYELDITKLTAKEKDEVRRQIADFHANYDLIQAGEYYRLTSPKEGCTAWEFAAPDGMAALIHCVSTQIEANPIPTHIKVQGLRDEALYWVELTDTSEFEDNSLYKRWFPERQALSGAALRHAGLTLPPAWKEYQAWQIRIKIAE